MKQQYPNCFSECLKLYEMVHCFWLPGTVFLPLFDGSKKKQIATTNNYNSYSEHFPHKINKINLITMLKIQKCLKSGNEP